MFRSAETFVLLAAPSGLLLAIGAMLDGGTGHNTVLTLMLAVSIGMDLVSYLFSDKPAIRMAQAQPMDERRFPDVHAMLGRQ